jgi:hypothetical protein
MSSYSGGSGADLFGNALDTEQQVAPQYRHLFPPDRAAKPGGQMQEHRHLIYPPVPAPSKKGKKRRKRPAPKKAP